MLNSFRLLKVILRQFSLHILGTTETFRQRQVSPGCRIHVIVFFMLLLYILNTGNPSTYSAVSLAAKSQTVGLALRRKLGLNANEKLITTECICTQLTKCLKIFGPKNNELGT